MDNLSICEGTTRMSDFKFQVDLKGIIKILSDNLYSNDQVFLRELLQNAIDAIAARKLNDVDFTDEKIIVKYIDNAEKKKAQLTFIDNGIGLTKDEIHEFLSIIGKSSKGGEQNRSSFIGQFGIGLLSCFLVANTIEVHTKSAKDTIGYTWRGKSDGTYDILENPKKIDQGTEVVLEIKGDMYNRYDDLEITESLCEYGYMLKTPIYFISESQTVHLNDNFIPWRQPIFTEGQVLEFGENIFHKPFFDSFPISGEGIEGYAFVSQNNSNSRNTNKHKIYLKDMFITESSEQLVPQWAFFIQCVINAHDLTPTASRESFYRDNKLLRMKSHIERCILEYLKTLASYNTPKLKTLIESHNVAIKSLMIENNNLYKMLYPFISFPTNKGYMTGKELIELSKKTTIYYCSEVDNYRKMCPIMSNNGKLLINAGYIYDASLINKLFKFHKNVNIKPMEEDAIGSILMDVDEDNNGFNYMLTKANEILRKFNCKTEIKSFLPSELSCLFVENDIHSFANNNFSEDDDSFFTDDFDEEDLDISLSKLYLNYNNPLIKKLVKIDDEETLQIIVEVLYLQSLMLGHHPIGSSEMKLLSDNLTKLVEFRLED